MLGVISLERTTFNALDPNSNVGCGRGSGVEQGAEETIFTEQASDDHVIIKDSCDVTVTTTDIQAAVNLQVAIQLAIALVLSVSIADGSQAQKIQQDLLQRISTKQLIRQKTYIENSRGIEVTMTDAEASVSIQLLLQVLLALVAKLDVL
ncbi:spore coat protein [Alicyclobacillus ferrooxydans]|uniref:Spore coat protein n=1 Tax=Alicyclobacillus ferrooxydans TaxID=471514 RepID=A0A0P9GP44_9BACL|nr:spore coat protein [Alicyclobacillus ferrooxydans]